jgi:hypothetical protein
MVNVWDLNVTHWRGKDTSSSAIQPHYHDWFISQKRQCLWINPLKTKRICFIQGLSAYRAVNTLHFGYKNQSLNVL